jgi:predicted GTPase
LRQQPETTAASADKSEAQNDPAKGKSTHDFVSTASAGLKAWRDAVDAMSEAGAGLMARAEPAIASVRTTASDASLAAEEAAGNVKARVTGWFQKTSSVPEECNSAAAPSPKVASEIEQLAREAAPVIWLLGKTGAGKSSVIAKLTGAAHAEVGNGFVPCTRTAQLFDFPQEAPLLRFLDTRGLGEPGYDPAEDLAWHRAQAHLVLVVMKAADPSQEEVVAAAAAIRQAQPDWPMLVVQTSLHELYPGNESDHPAHYPFSSLDAAEQAPSIPRELRNALAYQRGLFATVKGEPPLFVPVDFTQEADGFAPLDYGKAALTDAIVQVAPESVRRLVHMKLGQAQSSVAGQRMQTHQLQTLYWAAGAAAVGAAPVVGLVTVPVTQAAMLAQLAKSHGVAWGLKDVSALGGMLGAAIVANQGALLVLRQLAKLGPWVIPVAAAQDYAVTYALGRAACVYLQARQDHVEADAELVRTAFQAGLRQAFMASEKKAAA